MLFNANVYNTLRNAKLLFHKYSKMDALPFLIIYDCRLNCAIIRIIFRKGRDICDSFQQWHTDVSCEPL